MRRGENRVRNVSRPPHADPIECDFPPRIKIRGRARCLRSRQRTLSKSPLPLFNFNALKSQMPLPGSPSFNAECDAPAFSPSSQQNSDRQFGSKHESYTTMSSTNWIEVHDSAHHFIKSLNVNQYKADGTHTTTDCHQERHPDQRPTSAPSSQAGFHDTEHHKSTKAVKPRASILAAKQITEILELSSSASRQFNLHTEERTSSVRIYLCYMEFNNFRGQYTCAKGTQHSNWFAVSEEAAIRSVKRWRHFRAQRPYDDVGLLRARWLGSYKQGLLPITADEIEYDHKKTSKRYDQWIQKNKNKEIPNPWSDVMSEEIFDEGLIRRSSKC
ncbi:hypothetical protein K469DRAFT_695701 [Zopfia rhizophila CBS 207.26]|uniref:Uncharacterized protein n=1 Tax=Zopfia rhizophila CBS 207.26 TaxID=1314779 RepID=A0A6A6DFA3_9PEZI|nr:hypothetical protein K469DRAFT_695701 [Zopfia rhizophila CBS 207.26]